jgi:hypothetical protein
MSQEAWERINKADTTDYYRGQLQLHHLLGDNVVFYAGNLEIQLNKLPKSERLAVTREAAAMITPMLEAIKQHAPTIQAAKHNRLLYEENEVLQAILLKLQWGEKFALTESEQKKIKTHQFMREEKPVPNLPWRTTQADYEEITLGISSNIIKVESARSPELYPLSYITSDIIRIEAPLARALTYPKRILIDLHKGVDYWKRR